MYKSNRGEILYCSKCGTATADDAVFCTKCGNKFDVTKTSSELPNESLVTEPESGYSQDLELSEDIRQYLTANESVLAKFGFHRRKGGIYYATNKRLIHFKKKMFGSEFTDLTYKNINSLKQDKSIPKIIAIPGILILIFGLMLIDNPTSENYNFGMLVTGVGAVSSFLGFFYFKNVKYRFLAPGLDYTELNLWNIHIPFWQTSSKEQANGFAKIVRQKIVDA